MNRFNDALLLVLALACGAAADPHSGNRIVSEEEVDEVRSERLEVSASGRATLQLAAALGSANLGPGLSVQLSPGERSAIEAAGPYAQCPTTTPTSGKERARRIDCSQSSATQQSASVNAMIGALAASIALLRAV